MNVMAQIINHDISVEINVPAGRFWIRDADGREAQVRLEPDGKIYVCYTIHDRSTIVARDIPWDRFFVKFMEFADGL